MITEHDVTQVEISPEELAYCMANPVTGCTKVRTGQLKAIGNLAVKKALNITDTEAAKYASIAVDTGAAYVCALHDGKLAGVSPTVSIIKDTTIASKRIIVPANQVYKHPALSTHYTVGVFLRVTQSETGDIVTIQQASVAGWVVTSQLRRFIEKSGKPPFSVVNASLAIAPCDILKPLPGLQDIIRWQVFEI